MTGNALLPLSAALVALVGGGAVDADAAGIISIETGYTISRVCTARNNGRSLIVASSYEGTLLAIRYEGHIEWLNPLSGYMNHDIWCDDLTGDGADEILAANADGAVYCLSLQGELLWKFQPTDAPMNSVCVVRNEDTPYVVCGGYDMNMYYLTARGDLVKTIPSSTYSKETTWGRPGAKPQPENYRHIANHLRVIPQPDGSDFLAVHGILHLKSLGRIYLFKPLADLPFQMQEVPRKLVSGAIGAFRVCDPDGDGVYEVLAGGSGGKDSARLYRCDPLRGTFEAFNLMETFGRYLGRGYRVVQPTTIPDGPGYRYLALVGQHIVLIPPALDPAGAEILETRYSYNDLWKDPITGRIILASAQSGGSCIHLIDPRDPTWKDAYRNLTPPGKIATILENTERVRMGLKEFTPPAWEKPQPVYLMSESIPDSVRSVYDHIRAHYSSPVFLRYLRLDKQERSWRLVKDAAGEYLFRDDIYRDKRDARMRYVLSQEEVLQTVLPQYEGAPGVVFWGGHGNDPYMFQRETLERVLDGAAGKTTVLIYPEMGDISSHFEYALNDLFYPLAAYAQKRNGKLYLRSKGDCWQAIVYLPMWKGFLSGKYADVFVPALEETGGKVMDLSVAGRVGLWASGAANSWGARAVEDNASFSGIRKHCHQRLPNHFLRNMVYAISLGAQFINSFPVDQDYMSLLWELIAKGALYVPKRSEIVSFSPVHLSVTTPDPDYLEEGNNLKWLTFYDKEREENNPMVFSRMNGTWPGAPVTQWDFSRYAAGVKDRRLHFLPPYPNGLVLITPPQNGSLADKDAPRGALADHLHPLYRAILKEHLTDGKYYCSAEGGEKRRADQYYRTVEADIEAGAKKLPLTVSGDVAWVAAQTAPTHIRLTLVDSGYINPHARTANVAFHTVKPVKVTDVLDGKAFDLSDPSAVRVDVPLGLFRFIDVELTGRLGSTT